MLLFAGALVLVTALACGLAPAWLLSRSDLRDGLVSSARGSTGGGLQCRLRTWLVSGQIALALVLLANAAAFLRSFVRLSSEQPGFNSIDVQMIRFSLPQTGYPDVATIVQFYDQLHSRASAISGIKSDALISILPLAPKSISFVQFTGRTGRLRGLKTRHQPILPASSRQSAFGQLVSPLLNGA